MPLNDLSAQTQPQARPFAGALRRKERLEDPCTDLFRHTSPLILDSYDNVSCPVLGCNSLSADGQVSGATRHGIAGISQQIDEQVLQFICVPVNRWQVGLVPPYHLDVAQTEVVLDQAQRVFKDPVHVDLADITAQLARETAETPGRLPHAFEGSFHPLDELPSMLREALIENQHLEHRRKRCHRLRELVDDAACHCAYGGQAGRPTQCLVCRLRPFALADVSLDRGRGDHAAGGVFDRRHAYRYVDPSAIASQSHGLKLLDVFALSQSLEKHLESILELGREHRRSGVPHYVVA